MAQFDWDEYKEFKKFSHKDDKLAIAIDFMKSYYNISNPRDFYEMLRDDDIGQMMLAKRAINDAEKLENFIYQS